jgi:hypothetical protein
MGLVELIRSGGRALSRYTGTLFAVFVAQSLVAAVTMLAISVVLAQAFSHLPLFDQAVDGDLVALIWCIRHARANLFAVGGLVIGTLLLWQVVSWFLSGGIYGVLAERPDGRAATARCFGASGANTYLAYARLALCAVPGWALTMVITGASADWAGARLEYALTVSDLLGPLAVMIVPTLLLLHVLWTIVDYARVELTLRYDSHHPSVVVTYLRAIAFVLTRPLTLVHGAIGWLLFGLVTLAYFYLAHGHPMYGAGGAIALYLVRQGVALLRMAIRFAIMAGQVQLGEARPMPPLASDREAADR